MKPRCLRKEQSRRVPKEQRRSVRLRPTGHALRRLFVSTLVNDPAVSAEEALLASRHSSVAAQRPYMTLDQKSEANRFKALGLKPK